MTIMRYIGLAFVIGIVSGIIHAGILFIHVLPYMKKRGFTEPRYPFESYLINRAIAEYYRIDDPGEKRIKLLLKLMI